MACAVAPVQLLLATERLLGQWVVGGGLGELDICKSVYELTMNCNNEPRERYHSREPSETNADTISG